MRRNRLFRSLNGLTSRGSVPITGLLSGLFRWLISAGCVFCCRFRGHLLRGFLSTGQLFEGLLHFVSRHLLNLFRCVFQRLDGIVILQPPLVAGSASDILACLLHIALDLGLTFTRGSQRSGWWLQLLGPVQAFGELIRLLRQVVDDLGSLIRKLVRQFGGRIGSGQWGQLAFRHIFSYLRRLAIDFLSSIGGLLGAIDLFSRCCLTRFRLLQRIDQSLVFGVLVSIGLCLLGLAFGISECILGLLGSLCRSALSVRRSLGHITCRLDPLVLEVLA